MTLHTLELTSLLTRKKYYRLCNKMKNLDSKKWKADSENSMISWALQKFGIIICFGRILKSDAKFFRITFRLSPIRLFDHNNYIDLIETDELITYITNTNYLLQAISADFPKLETTFPSRVDFSFNYNIGTEFDAKNYIKLLHRGMVPRGFELGGSYNPIEKRWKPYPTSFYLKSPGFNLQIYDKYTQMISQKEGVFSEKEIAKAKGIIRFEIQCSRQKMRYLSKKFNFKNVLEFAEVADEIGESLFFAILPKITGFGSISTLAETKNAIRSSGIRHSDREIMLEMAEKANLYRKANLAIEEFEEKYGTAKTKKLLRKFDDIGSSLITIPNRMANNSFCYTTPFQMFIHYIANNRGKEE